MITTNDYKHLKLFDDGIAINYELPKWKNSNKRVALKQERDKNNDTPNAQPGNIYFTQDDFGTTTGTNLNTLVTSGVMARAEVTFASSTSEFGKVCFDEASKMAIRDLTDYINEIGAGTIYGHHFSNLQGITGEASEGERGKLNWFGKLLSFISGKFGRKERYSMSVIEFFENVKLIGKGSADTYKDRVGKYLEALHTAEITGQVALKEKLARGMFVNKYEAELYANGYYYVVSEKQIIDFANKTEKGVELIYLKNFARPLPDKVVKKLIEADSLEVFDNYAVLTYDPKDKDKIETEKEREKRKDPILFGLISGSDKLYYITDWIDEYCDLTLTQFVDTLDITKKDLKMK